MNCECNDNSNRVKPRIKHVYGNVLRMAIPLTLRTLVKDGDEMIVNDTDFIPSSDHLVRVVLSKGKTNYPITATMDGNVAIIEDKGKIPEGTYDISVECYDDLGNPYRFKQNAVLYVADTTADAGIDEEIEYETQTWYLNAAVFLATTEIGEIGDVIDTKLEDVFGNVLYDANAKEIRFYNKGNSRVLATIDSRPFIVDGTVADVYIDVSRQVLVVVLNEDAGGRRFSVPLYLVFNSYYKKDEVDSRISSSLENYYTKSHVDSLYSSLSSRVTPVEVIFTYSYNSITSNKTVNGIYTDYTNKKPIIGRYGNSVGTLLYISSQEAAFMFGDRYDSPFILRNSDSTHWGKEDLVDGSLSIEIDADPTEDSENAVSSGGVYNAIQGFVSAIKVNNEIPKYPVNGLVSLTIDSGGYEPPVGGIPKTDLASDVQASLGKADTALQSFTETDPTVPSWAKQQSKPTYTAQEVGALPASTTIPSKTSDLTNDSGFIDKAMYYGTSDTAAATMPKVCTVETFPTYTDNGVTHAKEGTIIAVKFTNSDTNTTDAPKLNVNGIGAKAIMYNNAIVTSTAKNTTIAGYTKQIAYYRYDPDLDEGNGAWEYLGKSVDSNSTYSNASLGQGYATQSNSAAATAITASISSYALSAGGIVTIKFTYDVPANATLNISSKGAKAIYNQGAAITAGVIKAGDTATFVYSTYYHLIAVDSWQDKQDAISDLATIRSGAAAGATAAQPADIPTKVSDLTNDSGFTSNAGTITGITMNGASKGTSGVVDLGTVITAHQDISGKANASDVYTKTQTDTLLSGKQNTLTFDSTPTASSTNPVTSGGVKTYVDGKASVTGITTSQDGTFTIAQSDGNSYTVNLNHVHPQYYTKTEIDTMIGDIETILASI